MQLTRNFSLQELTKSDTAIRKGIDNEPNADQIDKLGLEVVPIDLRDAYAFGGGLHCSTADVHREGELKDYFPNQ